MRSVLPVLLLSLLGCGPPLTRPERVAMLQGDAARGQALYGSLCASCHGADGGGSSQGPGLAYAIATKSPELIIKIVNDGVIGKAMASYARLSDQELADLYAHLAAAL